MECLTCFSKSKSLRKAVKSAAAGTHLVKAANLSHERAKQVDPNGNAEMFAKFAAHDQELISEGKIPASGFAAENVYNMDEIGFDPTGARARGQALLHPLPPDQPAELRCRPCSHWSPAQANTPKW